MVHVIVGISDEHRSSRWKRAQRCRLHVKVGFDTNKGPVEKTNFELDPPDNNLSVCTVVSAPQQKCSEQYKVHHTINALYNATEASTYKLRARDVAQLKVEPSVPFKEVVKRQQLNDELCTAITMNLLDKPDAPEIPQAIQRQLDDFRIGSTGILTKTIWYQSKRKGQTAHATVLPLNLVHQVLQAYHDDQNHMGFTHCHSTIRARYYWPGMYADISKHVLSCEACQLRKSGRTIPQIQGKVVTATRPFQVIAVDFVTIEQGSHGKYKAPCVLTITDLFTRFVRLTMRQSKIGNIPPSALCHMDTKLRMAPSHFIR